MKELFKRFNINVTLEDAQKKFINKINNILFNSQAFNSSTFKIEDFTWEFCNNIGLKYVSYQHFHDTYLVGIPFNEYLFRLQCLLDILYSRNTEKHHILFSLIDNAIDTSAIDIGLRIKFYKKKSAKIYFSGSKLLDNRLVDDILGVLEGEDKSAIKLAFEKGLKEFLESRREKDKLKNSIRDMQLACDEVVKFLFGDKNFGFRHLFKNDRWNKIGLNEYQKQIFWSLNEYVDKLFKHKADSKVNSEDAEFVIYLTGLFIRIILLKQN